MRVAVIMLAAAFIVEAFYIFLSVQMSAWQMYALSAVIAVFCLINIVALGFIRRGLLQTGSWLIVIGMLIVFPAAGALISNIGLIFGGALVLLTVMVAGQTLSGVQARNAILASIFLGLFTAGLDVIGLNYRLFVPEIQVFIPVITAVILLVMIAFIFLQYREAINARLQLKITIWVGLILLVISTSLVGYSTIISRQNAIQAAETHVLSEAQAQSFLIRAESEIPLDAARTLAQSFTSVLTTDAVAPLTRAQANNILRQVLIENPKFLGTYTLWEANAFDGKDAEYINQPAHDDTGRFIPYWVRGEEGEITVVALENYEVPGIGDWYLLPRQTNKEVAIAPLIYPIQGVDTIMASFVVPIIYQNKFYGVAGVDAPLFYVQEIVDSFDLYEGTAQAVLMTSSGTLIGVSNRPDLVNQSAVEVIPDFADFQERIQSGEEFLSISADGQYLRAFAPVMLGKTETPWSFVLIVPFSNITAGATAEVVRQVAISSVLILLGLALLWFLSGQIVRPLHSLSEVAGAIAGGNLNISAQVETQDEIGVLANTFNSMVSQLTTLFTTLEQRVAERTRGLELAAEFGRSVSRVRALDEMLRDAAEIIRSQFDLYYVQVYLVDASQTNLILKSGTGSVGEQLIRRGHRLPLNTASINGRAAIEKRSVVVSDTSVSQVFRPNPLLPDTHSEMAIPLLLGDQIVGVLNLQSNQANTLNQDNLPAFESLAAQLAVAVQNANLLEQVEQARAEVEKQASRLVRTNWQEYLDALHRPEKTGFVFENNQLKPLGMQDEIVLNNEVENLAVPIAITGQSIGSLVVDVDKDHQTPQMIQLVNTVARQVSQQIESLRLLEIAQRYRQEAEQVARRLTREGWEAYFKSKATQSLAYFYDSQKVKPLEFETARAAQAALTVPVRVRDETIGKLSILDVDSTDTEVLELVNIVSERLSDHIENLRLLEETQRGQIELDRRARQLAAISEISTISSRETDVNRMLERVVFLTQRKFNLYHAHIFTYNAQSNLLQIIACGWQEGDEREGTHGTTVIPLMQEQSLVARAARTRQPVVVNDVRSDPGWLPNPQLPDTHSELAVPLVIGDEILGVLDVQSDRKQAFSEEYINIMMTLAAQVATALQNARNYERAQKQAEREALLNTISQKIQSATSVEAVLQIAAREIGHALGAPRTVAQLSVKDRKE
ncbi:MAG: hypothetical protein OHK0052_19770 [Anaerolineales bacterium]